MDRCCCGADDGKRLQAYLKRLELLPKAKPKIGGRQGGHRGGKGFQSHELLEATLPIFDTNKCNMRYGGKIDGETQFCAGYSKLKSENALTFNIYLFVF